MEELDTLAIDAQSMTMSATFRDESGALRSISAKLPSDLLDAAEKALHNALAEYEAASKLLNSTKIA